MNAQALLETLQTRGFRIGATGNAITVKPASPLTDEDRTAIRAHKAELLAFLKSAAEQYDWKKDCAELFTKARAQVERNLSIGNCPDCGSRLVANKHGNETMQYCQACDLTWRASDFAEIQTHLAKRLRKI